MTTTVAALVRVTCSGCGALHAKREGNVLRLELGDRHTYITMLATVTGGDRDVAFTGGIVQIICRRCHKGTVTDLRGT